MRKLASAILFCAGASALGCADHLPKATEIVHMRMLGVKLEVVGDETRTTPKPGEKVKVSFDVVFPKESSSTKSSQMLLISCTAPTRYTGGIAVCQEFLDAAQAGQGAAIQSALAMAQNKTTLRCADLPGPRIESKGVALQCLAGDPTLTLDVGANFTAARMLFLGVFCERGTPLIDINDPGLFSCEHNSGETVRLNGLIPIEHKASDVNHNPSLDDLTIVMDPYTHPWLPATADLPPEESCVSADQEDQSKTPMLTLPHADPGDHKLTLSYDAAAREKVDGVPEDLELTIYTTAGKMERRFTLWNGTDNGDAGVDEPPKTPRLLEADVDWSPPEPSELPKGGSGKLVRFFVTLRDQRGGFDSALRAACVH